MLLLALVLPANQKRVLTPMSQFSWIPLYEELVTALLSWSNRQSEFMAFLYSGGTREDES